MSKDLPQQSKQPEEVDLGQLFKMIGNVIERFFVFIGKILGLMYDFILLLLIHFFKRLKWYALVIILGVVIGYFLDKQASKFYGANMQIETRYNSARQVYENISYLNQLAATDRDSVELARGLNITPSEASSIKGFSIEPNIDENDKMKLFSDFRAQLDSLTKSTFTYNDYIEGLTSHSFKTHQIEVISTDKFIYPKLNSSLPKELADNSYLDEVKEVTLKSLDKKELVLLQQQEKLDSLSNFYLNIRKSESEKQAPNASDGTNFYLGEVQRESLVVDETKLVERRSQLDSEILSIDSQRLDNKYIVNPISEFPAAGYDLRKWTDKAKYRLPVLFAFITLLIFILIGLQKYLSREEKRLLGEKQ